MSVWQPSAAMMERARTDPFFQKALALMLDREQSYMAVLEKLALALADEKNRLFKVALAYAERVNPDLLGVNAIKVFPDPFIHYEPGNQPTAAKPTTPWSDSAHDIMKDIRDAMAEAKKVGQPLPTTETRTMKVGKCKKCGEPFHLKVVIDGLTWPPMIGKIAIEEPYDFMDPKEDEDGGEDPPRS